MGIEIEEGTLKPREDAALRIYFSSLLSLLFLGGDVRVAAMDALFTSSFSYSASLLSSSSLPLSGLVSPSSAARCCTREQAARRDGFTRAETSANVPLLGELR